MKNIVLSIVVVAALILPISAICAPSDDLLNRLQHNGLVNDFAGVIDAADETRISNLVTEVQQKTTAAIAVVTLKSMEGGDVAAGELRELAHEPRVRRRAQGGTRRRQLDQVSGGHATGAGHQRGRPCLLPGRGDGSLHARRG
jgi:hypothetical protein